jgi:hypothetical protein
MSELRTKAASKALNFTMLRSAPQAALTAPSKRATTSTYGV